MEVTPVPAPKKQNRLESIQPVYPKVRLAFLHQAIQIPGCISSEKTLSHAKIPGIKMSYAPMGLLIEVKNTKAVVPSANVAVAIFEET